MGVFIRKYRGLLVKRRPRVAMEGTVLLGRAFKFRRFEDGDPTNDELRLFHKGFRLLNIPQND